MGSGSGGDDVDVPAGSVRRDTTVEVDGRRIEVSMWVPDPAEVETLGGRPRRSSAGSNASGGVGNGQVAVGDSVGSGDVVVVISPDGSEAAGDG